MDLIADPLATPRRSLASRPRRREELLQAAARLFAERGFVGVTVDDIGAAVGVTGPAIYHHFDGKESLLGEMLVSISEWLLDHGRRIVAEAGSASAALDELIDLYARFAVDRSDLIAVHYRELVHATEEHQRTVRQLQGKYVALWAGVLTSLNSEISAAVARTAVHAAFGLLNSTPYSSTVRNGASDHADELFELLRSMTRRALTF